MGATIFSIAFALFLLMDPLGNVSLFVSLLKNFPAKKQKKIIFRELLFALAIIILFYFAGDYLLDLIQVQQYTILISGGVILFLIALRMIFPEVLAVKQEEVPLEEPFIVPLAIPLVAGPAVLAAVMLYSQQNKPVWTVLTAIFIAWIATTVILLASNLLKNIFKEKGLIALERLTGLLLTLIAIQMFLQGISLYLLEHNSL